MNLLLSRLDEQQRRWYVVVTPGARKVRAVIDPTGSLTVGLVLQ
jgi:hypothetical protein